jgi:hypothetical protein
MTTEVDSQTIVPATQAPAEQATLATTTESGTVTNEAASLPADAPEGNGESSKESDTKSPDPLTDIENPIQRRIEVARRQGREESAKELEYWKKAAMDKDPKPAPATTPSTSGLPREPKLTDSNNIEVFTKDWRAWEKQVDAIQAAETAKITTYQSRAQEFAKTQKDFDSVINAGFTGVNLADGLMDYFVESELGPKVAYALAKNIAELDRVNALPTKTARVRALAQLEVKLAADGPKPTVKNTAGTPAPKPATPTTGTVKVPQKSEYDMTPQELIIARNKSKRYR